jgi:hypothetical protein
MAKQYMFDFSHFFCNHPVYNEMAYLKEIRRAVSEMKFSGVGTNGQ